MAFVVTLYICDCINSVFNVCTCDRSLVQLYISTDPGKSWNSLCIFQAWKVSNVKCQGQIRPNWRFDIPMAFHAIKLRQRAINAVVYSVVCKRLINHLHVQVPARESLLMSFIESSSQMLKRIVENKNKYNYEV